MSFFDTIQTNLDFDKKLLLQVDGLKVNAPAGHLVLQQKGHSRNYAYRAKGSSNLQYIKKADAKIANDMRLTRFLAETRKRLNSNIALQENFLQAYLPTDFFSVNASLPMAYQYFFDDAMPYENFSRKKPLNAPRDVKPWITQSQNPYKRENLIHKTSFGLRLRSKGELELAEIMYIANVEFVYEKPLSLLDRNGNSVTVYPDFTIFLPRRKVMYWEHKGMLWDDGYFSRDQEKMQLYYINDIYPIKNLIVTSDGPDGSFDAEDMMRIISGILLPQM